MKHYLLLILLFAPCIMVVNDGVNYTINLFGLSYCIIFGLFLASKWGKNLMRKAIKGLIEFNKIFKL